jgi:hypothetical protein
VVDAQGQRQRGADAVAQRGHLVVVPPVVGGEVVDDDRLAGVQGVQAGALVVAVLDLVDLAGSGVAVGHGDRATVAAQSDPAGQVAGRHRDGELRELGEESADVLGGQQQLL